jgi:long-chain acyl-CoA synthetase
MQPANIRIVGPGSPFELVEHVIDGEVCRDFRHGPRTLIDLYRRLGQYANRTLIVTGSDRRTYRQINGSATRLSDELVKRFCVGAGTRVGIVVENCPAWLAAFIAVTSLSATAVLVSRDMGIQRLTESLAIADCRVVICDSATAHVLADCAFDRPLLVVNESIDDLPDPERIMRYETARNDPEQEAVIAFTSGTSGLPKGVVLSHRCIMSGLMNMLLGGALSSYRNHQQGRSLKASPPSTPISLLVAPFSYIAGYSHFLLMAYLGGTIVTMSDWDAALSLDLLARENIHSLAGATPTMLRELLGLPRAQDKLSVLTSVGIHGAALNAKLLDELKSFLPLSALKTGYGMTETSGSICVASGQDIIERPMTSGPILPTVGLKLVRDEFDNQSESTRKGEIWLRGAMVMKEYCGQPDLSRRVLKDNWLRTGDIGRVDADGFLYIVDRVNEVVSSNGDKISCAEIEQVLSDEGVTEQVSAFGIPDAQYGERLILAIVPSRRCDFDGEIVRKRLAAAHAAGAEVSRFMLFDRLPYTPSGKVDRRELRRLALKQLSSMQQ